MDSINPNSRSIYQDEMDSVKKAAIGPILTDLQGENTAVQNAGNPDFDPNNTDS